MWNLKHLGQTKRIRIKAKENIIKIQFYGQLPIIELIHSRSNEEWCPLVS